LKRFPSLNKIHCGENPGARHGVEYVEGLRSATMTNPSDQTVRLEGLRNELEAPG